jgi:hypothetical protein
VAADAADVVFVAGGVEGDGGRAVGVAAEGASGVAGVVVALGDHQHVVVPGGVVEHCRMGRNKNNRIKNTAKVLSQKTILQKLKYCSAIYHCLVNIEEILQKKKERKRDAIHMGE